MLANTPKAGQDMLLPKLAGDMIRGSKSGQIGLHELPSRQKLNNPTTVTGSNAHVYTIGYKKVRVQDHGATKVKY